MTNAAGRKKPMRPSRALTGMNRIDVMMPLVAVRTSRMTAKAVEEP